MPNGWIILDKPVGLGSTEAVGAVKHTVALNFAIAVMRSAGVVFSIRIEAAPMRMGNKAIPPSPKVKAIGAVLMNRSSAAARKT